MAQHRREGCAPSEKDDWTHVTRGGSAHLLHSHNIHNPQVKWEMMTTGPTKETPPLFYSHLGHWNGALQACMDRNLHSRFKKETQLTTFCFCFAKRQQWEPYQNMQSLSLLAHAFKRRKNVPICPCHFRHFPIHPLCKAPLYCFILVGPILKTNAKTDNFLSVRMSLYPDFTWGGEGGFHNNIGWPLTDHGLFLCWTHHAVWLTATWTNQIW